MYSLVIKTTIGAIITTITGFVLLNYSEDPKLWMKYISIPEPVLPEACESHRYSTEIVSIDPLVVYINDFVSQAEAQGLVAVGEDKFASSEVYLHGRKAPSSDRTSLSAGLPLDDRYVNCVLERARNFMGASMPSNGNFGIPQLVRYNSKQRFDLHHDWYDRPHRLADGRLFNRPASFFVFLQDNCTDGETYFPYIKPWERRKTGDEVGTKWRIHKDGGVAFKPIAGNALFWVNLFRNGTGDTRVMHAGLPVGDGLKTAMNIWPRKYYS